MIDTQSIRWRWDADGSKRDERGRRLFAACEVRAAGWGGLVAVSEITGLARSTIERGLKDLDAPPLQPGQVRREGGGPRPLTERDATLLRDLKRLVEPATLGDPVRPLLWVSKSLDKLTCALAGMGHAIIPNSVRKLLTELGYSRQANRKADEGSNHPDRNAQFDYINAEVVAAQAAGQPVISVDTKKKSSLATIATVAAITGRRAIPNACMCMTSRTRTSARLHLMACTTLPPMPDGSASGSHMTQPSSRSLPFAHGTKRWGGCAIRRPVS